MKYINLFHRADLEMVRYLIIMNCQEILIKQDINRFKIKEKYGSIVIN